MEYNPYPYLIPNVDWRGVYIPLTATDVSRCVWNSRPGSYWRLRSASVRFSTQSTSGTVAVEVTPSGVATGSGTAQTVAPQALSAAGSVNTHLAIPLIREPTVIRGTDSVSIVVAGTMTGLANCVLCLWIEQLNKGSESDL